MANIISKEAYQYLKGLPPEELDDTDREKMNDYERAEVNAPSNDDVKWATHIHNAVTSNPHTHGYDKEEVDWANDILAQESRYFHLKGGRANDVYVQPVKRIPKDLIEGNDFKFNWKSAYENIKGEKLRDTEADYDKLKKFIDSNMFELNDPNVDLQKIAYNFHMYDPSKIPSELKTKEEIDAYFKNPWSYFINSKQGEEFKKYLEDVRENQRKASIEKIFSGEEPSKANYPIIGPTDVPGSNTLVDFGIPVAKEYAKKELLAGRDPNIGPALGFDAATQGAMFFGGKPGLVLAPTISNVGQAVYNDLDPAVATVNSVLGAGTNAITPYIMQRGGRYLKTPGTKYSQKVAVQGRADELAKQAADTERKLTDGAIHSVYVPDPKSEAGRKSIGYINEPKKILYTDNADQAIKTYGLDGYTVRPLAEARKHNAGMLTDKEMDTYWANKNIARNNWIDVNLLKHPVSDFKKSVNISKERNLARERLYDKMNKPEEYFVNRAGVKVKKPSAKPPVENVLKAMAEGKKISDMDMKELYALGYKPKESVTSFLWRISPDLMQNYFTNFMGRNVPAGATMRIPNMLFGTDLNKFVKEKKNEKPKITEIFGE